MGAFSAFPYLGAVEVVEVVARSQLCLILKGLFQWGKKAFTQLTIIWDGVK